MKASNIIWTIVVAIILLGGLAWWASTTPAMQPVSQPTTVNTVEPIATPVLGSMTSTSTAVGNYLVDSNSMTLYVYSKDTTGVSNCTGTCSTMWPPYTVSSSASLTTMSGSVSGTIGTITRTDGTMQVTYNGKPLYYNSKDVVSGDMKGENVGGVWSVVKL